MDYKVKEKNFQYPFLGFLLFYGRKSKTELGEITKLSISIFRISTFLRADFPKWLEWEVIFQYPFLGFLLFYRKEHRKGYGSVLLLSISIFRISTFLRVNKEVIPKQTFFFQYPFLGFLLFYGVFYDFRKKPDTPSISIFRISTFLRVRGNGQGREEKNTFNIHF